MLPVSFVTLILVITHVSRAWNLTPPCFVAFVSILSLLPQISGGVSPNVCPTITQCIIRWEIIVNKRQTLKIGKQSLHQDHGIHLVCLKP